MDAMKIPKAQFVTDAASAPSFHSRRVLGIWNIINGITRPKLNGRDGWCILKTQDSNINVIIEVRIIVNLFFQIIDLQQTNQVTDNASGMNYPISDIPIYEYQEYEEISLNANMKSTGKIRIPMGES